MTRWLALPLAVLALAALCMMTSAGEETVPEDLLKVVQQQNEKIDALLSRVKGLEDNQDAVRSAISEGFERTESLASKLDNEAAGGGPPWVHKTRLYGDFRYRHEFFDVDTIDPNRTRHRIRVRIGLHAHPCDDLDFYFRLASGNSDDARTVNQTLDNYFSSKQIWLDLAYFDWHPAILFGVHFLGGKMVNPFFRAGGEEMIFDSDVNPEGLALKYSIRPIEITRLFATAGGFWMDERPDQRDAILYGVQAGVEQGIGDYVTVTAGGSYYDFGRTRGESVYGGVGGGNSIIDLNAPADPDEDGVLERPKEHLDTYYDTPGGPMQVWRYAEADNYYLYDYQLVEVFTQVDIKAGPVPVSIISDFVKNTAPNVDMNTGWLAGFSVGKTRGKAGTWQLVYNYRDVEADAVPAIFATQDMGLGADTTGHKVSAAFMLTRCMKFKVSYFKSELGQTRPEGPESWDNDYQRLQVDLILTF